MNIRSAAGQVESAARAYLAKDARGFYLIPFEMQRPIILMGPPGIGKTAIVSQIAERLHINFVSYSITHHTRQSALGLPYIAEASYGGRDLRVSRYTMSEIIGAAYDAVERTGVAEGILFLDEVNCVSETLAPAMLQFLQYKTFGQHRLPAGWVIVCAGNPPEYNRAAREFDPAMMDRLKRIDVEPDLAVWMDYAHAHGVHPAITTYLESKPQNFYRVRSGTRGARIVTARGWEDLSRMIQAYAHEGLAVDRDLVGQYLQDPDVADDFSLYLELFERYRDDYKVAGILAGTAPQAVRDRARQAPLDERVALINLMLEVVSRDIHDAWASEQALRDVRGKLASLKDAGLDADGLASGLEEAAGSAQKRLEAARGAGSAQTGRLQELGREAELLHDALGALAQWRMAGGHGAADKDVASAAAAPATEAFDAAKQPFNEAVRTLSADVAHALAELGAAYAFIDDAFGADGQEALIFSGALATDGAFTRFAAAHPSDSYLSHSKALMFHERGLDLLDQADKLAGA